MPAMRDCMKKQYNILLFPLPGLRDKNRKLVTGSLKLMKMVGSFRYIKYPLCGLCTLGSAMTTDTGRNSTFFHV